MLRAAEGEETFTRMELGTAVAAAAAFGNISDDGTHSFCAFGRYQH
jgi:hypothetical protein